MVSFEPTEEQHMLVEAVGKYAGHDLRAISREAEESRELPMKVIGKGWELGLLQASIPESFGGFGERHIVIDDRLAVKIGHAKEHLGLEIDDRDHAVVRGQQPFFAPLPATTVWRH